MGKGTPTIYIYKYLDIRIHYNYTKTTVFIGDPNPYSGASNFYAMVLYEEMGRG